MRMAKNSIKFVVVITVIASLFGCTPQKPQVLDKTGMVYQESDDRIDYASVFDFDSYDGQPMFAVAFLGYGDRMEFRNTYVEEVFESLDNFDIKQVGHLDYEGDEWYLVVPRCEEDVEIRNLETGEVQTVHNGEAFTVKCNLSDLHSNIEISTAIGLSGHIFSPQIGGDGKLVENPDVWDITDYEVLDAN